MDTSEVDITRFTMGESSSVHSHKLCSDCSEHELLGAAFPPSTPGLFFFPALDKRPPFKQYPMRPSQAGDQTPQVQSLL